MAEDIEAKEISQLDSLAVRDSALIPIYDPQYGLGKATMDSVKEVCGVGTTRNGVCSTAGATQDKAVSYSGFILSDGKEIVVKFTNANTATNPRLNVNSTGAKTIKFMDQASGVSAGLNCFVAGAYYKFTYNATDNVWVCHSNIVERDNSAGYTKYADGKTVYNKYTAIAAENFISLNEGFSISECYIYKCANHVTGFLSILNDGNVSLLSETNIGNIKSGYSPVSMNRGIYCYCGDVNYKNKAQLYCAVSSNTVLRVCLNDTTVTQSNKKYINFQIDYICY